MMVGKRRPRIGMDPRLARFKQQKGGARRRGIEWCLEFWEWLQIWDDSGHFHERGTGRDQWVMARKGDLGPYATGNVDIVRAPTNTYQGRLKTVREGRHLIRRSVAG
jgi:hypothetical protein